MIIAVNYTIYPDRYERRHLEDWVETNILVPVLEGVIVNLDLHLVPVPIF